MNYTDYYHVHISIFIAQIAINAIIELNISYKVVINNCAINMQIVVILSNQQTSTQREHDKMCVYL